MSEITINACDGCLKAGTARKPVLAMELSTVETPEEGEPVRAVLESFDAHDIECSRRYLTKVVKSVKEAAKAERETVAAPQEKAKK